LEGKVSSEIVSLSSGSSFYFQDSYVPSLPAQVSKIYKGASGALENIDASGPQVSIVNLAGSGRNIIFSSIPNEVHNSLSLTSDYSMIFKVVDDSCIS
jgi:hypothetical protein